MKCTYPFFLWDENIGAYIWVWIKIRYFSVIEVDPEMFIKFTNHDIEFSVQLRIDFVEVFRNSTIIFNLFEIVSKFWSLTL